MSYVIMEVSIYPLGMEKRRYLKHGKRLLAFRSLKPAKECVKVLNESVSLEYGILASWYEVLPLKPLPAKCFKSDFLYCSSFIDFIDNLTV